MSTAKWHQGASKCIISYMDSRKLDAICCEPCSYYCSASVPCKQASEAISEHLIFNNFPSPQTPQSCKLFHAYIYIYSRHPVTPLLKLLAILVCIYSGMHLLQSAFAPVCIYSDLHLLRSAFTPVCIYSGMHLLRYAFTSVCIYSGTLQFIVFYKHQQQKKSVKRLAS